MKRGLLLIAACFILNGINTAGAQSLTDSLLIYLPMDGNTLDVSGNGNNGINHNVVADTNRFGQPGTAFRFNGIDSYIEIPASPSMNKIQTSNIISISAWVNIFQWYNNVNVFSIFERYNPVTDAGWLFEANWVGGGLLFLADETNTNNWIGANYPWNFHQWHHLAMTYDHSQSVADFYVDSVLVGSIPYTASIFGADTTLPFSIGRSLAGPDEYSDGLIDDYRIYNRVLTQNDIGTIYTTGLKSLHSDNDINLYPNPAGDLVNIKMPASADIIKWKLIDCRGISITEGRIDSKSSSGVIDVNGFAPGIYFLQLNMKDRIIVKKIIKQ